MPVASAGHALSVDVKPITGKQQQNITTLLTDRVRKPRHFSSGSRSVSKCPKRVDKAAIHVPTAVLAAPIVPTKRKRCDALAPRALTALSSPTVPKKHKQSSIPSSPTISFVSNAQYEKQISESANPGVLHTTTDNGPSVKRRKGNPLSSESTSSIASLDKIQESSKPSIHSASPTQVKQFVPTGLQAQKRKWKLARIVAKDRELHHLKSSNRPSFVFIPETAEVRPSSPRQSCSEINVPSDAVSCENIVNASPSTSNRMNNELTLVPEAEVLLHDRSILPTSYGLLIDVLTSIETALSLLLTRHIPPTVENVRPIVQRDTGRHFTLRMLAQLACVVPECVAVVEPLVWPMVHDEPEKKLSDSLIIRLDDPNGSIIQTSGKLSLRPSAIGDQLARLRRVVLQRRLLGIVRKHHEAFVEKHTDRKPHGAVWHPDFIPDRDVGPLPAPPLYDECALQAASLSSRQLNTTKDSLSILLTDDDPTKLPGPLLKTEIKSSQHGKKQSDEKTGHRDLPVLVKTQKWGREDRVERADKECEFYHSLLSELPCTMDLINSMLQTERRSAVGWRHLLRKVAGVHPRKWQKEDIERQLNAIVKLATQWCSKVELKSSRRGYAFRVVSETGFAAARAAIVETKYFPGDLF